MKKICYIDTEVSVRQQEALEFGAINEKGDKLSTKSPGEFKRFIAEAEYLCGHNIIDHDSKFIDVPENVKYIDTLYLSPLLFPDKSDHALEKDTKLRAGDPNDPLIDSEKARELFCYEQNAFDALDGSMKRIYYLLLKDSVYFSAFFEYMGYSCEGDITAEILERFRGKLCENAPISELIDADPLAPAYALALISAKDGHLMPPGWVRNKFPKIGNVMRALRGIPCGECEYCRAMLDPLYYLDNYFGYKSFREYEGEPLQENAVRAAVAHKSLLAIFPTGGGKSLTFQIPAFMAAKTERALTVVISPLQSLMNDQVENLVKRGRAEAVTINGSLDPLKRQEAFETVSSGVASLLYISPESLRSSSIESLLLSRKIDRFVIDEAHCFSAWGQDFRVDYMYIGEFIKELQGKKGYRIPVSCFTATAKQKVISDIKDYFRRTLDIELELFSTSAARTNLRYDVLYKETEDDKYEALRELIRARSGPAIVYVSTVKKTHEIAEKLTKDGISARPFNGKMKNSEKRENQDAFMEDKVQVIVATTAFGMGVDKSDVGLVVHYEISASLEDYVQEAGRAGRDPELKADCYVLFNDNDLDTHFSLLRRSMLTLSEIQQVWKAVNTLTRNRPEICCSPLEVAREAGWEENDRDIETKVTTAISALEDAGYLKRGQNASRVFATSILVKNMNDAIQRIDTSSFFDGDDERKAAKRIMSSLISSKSIAKAGNDEAESRVDYLADRLGLKKKDVIDSIQRLKSEGILDDDKDMTAYIKKTDSESKINNVLRSSKELELFMLDCIDELASPMKYKKLNTLAVDAGINSSVSSIKRVLYFWTKRGYAETEYYASAKSFALTLKRDVHNIREECERRFRVAGSVVSFLFGKCTEFPPAAEEIPVGFSILELKKAAAPTIDNVTEKDIENALLFLSEIGALKLEGGFFVLYSRMRIKRKKRDSKTGYNEEDYRKLNEFYRQRMQQIHIVGEYANIMMKSYSDALNFVADYFGMDYKEFLGKYFSGDKAEMLRISTTPAEYQKMTKDLSERQMEVFGDCTSRNIAVAACPASGATRLLVHKLAALLRLEGIKPGQVLVLTFSRAAVSDLRRRLVKLIGKAAYFAEINTFHGYAFDLLERMGDKDGLDTAVGEAVKRIESGTAELSRITRSVLAIDEAENMTNDEYRLVNALIKQNGGMRVIVAGDDDRGIDGIRGADPGNMKKLIQNDFRLYTLNRNYANSKSVTDLANAYTKWLRDRIKTEEQQAVSSEQGEVRLIKHKESDMREAVAEDIASTAASGATCVLTYSDEYAQTMLETLQARGIAARLLPSGKVSDIAEVRSFVDILTREAVSGTASPEQWTDAVKELEQTYSDGPGLSAALEILKSYAAEHNAIELSDLKQYIYETGLDSFFKGDSDTVTVASVRKARRLLFDNVYILAEGFDFDEPETRRLLYVGITRAKKLLHIHYRASVLDRFTSVDSGQ